MLKRLTLLGLLAAMLMLSGCALIEMDEAVDAASVVITMKEKTFTKGEVKGQIEAYYGDISGYDAQSQRQIQEYVVEAMIQQAMMDQKVAELGLDQLTAEEEALVKEKALEAAEADRAAVRADLFADSADSPEAVEEAVTAYLNALGATEESYETYARAQVVEEKLISHVLGQVTVSQQELQNELDWLAENDRAAFEENLQGYEERVNGGDQAYYTPAGYRYVKMIKREFLEEDRRKIETLEKQIAEGEGDAQLLQTQLEEAKAAAYAHLSDTMTEITGRIAGGEDFDALVAEYGQDPLAKAAPILERGYAVSADSNAPGYEAVLAAMTLSAAGDVSEPVKLSDGMAILKYEGDIPEGPIALEAVQTELEESVMASKRDVLFYGQLEAWTEEAQAKVDYDVLNR